MNIRRKINKTIKRVLLAALRTSLTHSYLRFLKPISLLALSIHYRPKISTVCSVAEYVQTSRDEVIFLDNTKLVFCAPQYDRQKKELQYVDSTLAYIAILRDVSVLAESNLIYTATGLALNDMMAGDTDHRLSFNYNKGFDCIVNQNIICTVFDKKEVVEIEKGVMITGNYSFNYFHLTYEIMPRLKDIDRIIPLDVPLLIDESMLRYSQYRDLFKLCNVSRREVIVLPSNCEISVGTLYYPSILSHIIPNVRRVGDMNLMDNMYDIESLRWLRRLLLPARSEVLFGKKIFLYRKGGVRMFNQDEIFDMLSDYGYLRVSPEEISIADQISLFSNATHIVSGSGAALTNVLYCTSGCNIFVLTNSRYDHISIFPSIASFVGANMRYIDAGEPFEAKNYRIHKDFHISPNLLLEVINEQI